MGYIYIITSPSGKSYIGQTIRPIQERLKSHRKKRNRCLAIFNAIQKYGWNNLEKDWYECPDEDLNFDEDLLIREMETMYPGGYNLKEGGANGKPSEESKRKMREAHVGQTLSDETKWKISEAHIGQKKSTKTRKNMSKAQSGAKNPMYGTIASEETRQKMSKSRLGDKNHNSKKVYQYNIDNSYIRSFETSGEAACLLGKTDGSNIRKCVRGNKGYKIVYGFKWSYIKTQL